MSAKPTTTYDSDNWDDQADDVEDFWTTMFDEQAQRNAVLPSFKNVCGTVAKLRDDTPKEQPPKEQFKSWAPETEAKNGNDAEKLWKKQRVVFLLPAKVWNGYPEVYLGDEVKMGLDNGINIEKVNGEELEAFNLGTAHQIMKNLLIDDDRTSGIPRKLWSKKLRGSKGVLAKATNPWWKKEKTEDVSPYPRPCTMPHWMEKNKTEKGSNKKHNDQETDVGCTLWADKPCFCHASMRGFAATDRYEELSGLLGQLLPFHNIIHNNKKTNSSKTAFCYFHRALVPVYEKDKKDKTWTNYHFVLRGDDVRPSKDKRHGGFARLCRHGLAMLLGKWTHNDDESISRHDEQAFSLQFYQSCIEPKNQDMCQPRLQDSVTVAQWFDDKYKKNLLRNLILEVAIRCLIEEEGYVPTGDVYLPRSPTLDKVFFHWYAAKLVPITKSIVLSHETFKEYSDVLKILGTENNNQVQNMQIADH